MKFKIRIAKSDRDLEQVYALDLIIFGKADGAYESAEYLEGHVWWLVTDEKQEPVAYCGLSCHETYAYYAKVGVVNRARGHGLQKKLSRIMENYARKNGMTEMVTYVSTTNPISANNLINSGYRVYVPQVPWVGTEHYVYLRKVLNSSRSGKNTE